MACPARLREQRELQRGIGELKDIEVKNSNYYRRSAEGEPANMQLHYGKIVRLAR